MKNILFIFIICFSFSCGIISDFKRIPAAEDEFIHVVLDIDWTIVAQIHEGSEGISKSNLVRVGDETYRIKDWAREFVSALSKNPKIKISFFSGGGEPRNLELLSKIKLMNGSGKSFLDVSHKVLSYKDLTEIPEALRTGDRFSDRFKKDLSKLGFSEGKTLMVDDNYRFAVNEVQQRHYLWLGPTFNHYEKFSDIPSLPIGGPEAKFVPNSYAQWFLGRNKLAAVWDIMEQSIDKHLKSGIPVDKTMQDLSKELDLASGDLNGNLKRSIDKGSKKLRRLGFQKGRVFQGNNCSLLIEGFF
ncbi:MAG: hypothetical protein KC493_04830 [Bacteriovoracaceae bacterium]|nr:hypothetical protein [Bacteriovoracaceae bacterium]